MRKLQKLEMQCARLTEQLSAELVDITMRDHGVMTFPMSAKDQRIAKQLREIALKICEVTASS